MVLAGICHQVDIDNRKQEQQTNYNKLDDVYVIHESVQAIGHDENTEDAEKSPGDGRDDTADAWVVQCNLKHDTNGNENQFHGACIDSGVQLTVIGRNQMLAYCKLVGRKFKPRSIKRWYRFRNKRHKEIGRATLKMPISTSYTINICADVFDSNVLFLLGLDIMESLETVLDFGK